MTLPDCEGLLRGPAPRVHGTSVHRYGRSGGGEDAVQEAVLAAAVQWSAEGVPNSPIAATMT
ncbi:hypothetical protein [Kitasatospora griseola]|uniref:hypothetical protein n=1 Tax=Kitasatospora griseola TaxID=2064 RepID=UPI003821FDBE